MCLENNQEKVPDEVTGKVIGAVERKRYQASLTSTNESIICSKSSWLSICHF